MVRAAVAIAIKEYYARRDVDLLTTFNEHEIKYCDLLAKQVDDLSMEDIYRQAFDALFGNFPAQPEASTGTTKRSRFATLGKYCVCGHGICSHRNSAGAEETYCRRCSCVQYKRDTENPNDWSKRDEGELSNHEPQP